MKRFLRSVSALVLAVTLCGASLCAVRAQELSAVCGEVTALSAVFSEAGEDTLRGIYVVSVPSAASGLVQYGSRTLRPGDVLSCDALSQLTLTPVGPEDSACELVYCPITPTGLSAAETLHIRLRSRKNSAPVAEDSALETYKNISNSASLRVSDPDGDELTYQLVKAPRRGSVELCGDGRFTYTPAKNKVGRDSFVFTATDAAGNVSEEATVSIRIVKPTDRAMYQDVSGTDAEYLAMWMKEQGLYSGRQIGGNLCFEPDAEVGRGEFLVMAMHLLGAGSAESQLSSGFSDESQTPVWMRPYIVSALRSGMISGVRGEDGMVFRPTLSLTRAEAAVMLQNILDLPSGSTAAFAGDESPVPVWAQEAVSALTQSGIPVDIPVSAEPITRLECAAMLCEVSRLQQQNALGAFYWEE